MAARMRTLNGVALLRVLCSLAVAAAPCLLVLACAPSAAVEPRTPALPSDAVAAPTAAGPVSAQAIVDALDRTPEDRQADARRHPVQLLEFLGVSAGQRVADLAAGSGYTTELLARAVGPTGAVYAQNDQATIDKYVTESWPKRLERAATRNVVRMDREIEAPFSADARDLDLVTLLFSYHDVIAAGADRGQLNAAVFRALKPGGFFVLADHQAPPGTGIEAASSLHRIDEKIVRQEVEAAGFTFVESAEFLHDANDNAKEPSFKLGFNTDRFILKFKKPEAP
jgi:predicted methyltransferase